MTQRERQQGNFFLREWLIEPQLNQISRPGLEERLNPKTMDVLLYLAERPDEVVSKGRIIQAVWSGSFVTDDVLISAIYELRKALRDNAKNPRFIQTISE